MPPITEHQSSHTTKLLLLGHSGAGKTGALASLAAAGYNLRILDLDNGLDILKDYLSSPKSPYMKNGADYSKTVCFQTLTDEMKQVGGNVFPVRATVWQRVMNQLQGWDDGAIKLGKLVSWTDTDILVVDSLSTLARAAFNFDLQMNGFIGRMPTQNEARRSVWRAQDLLRGFLDLIYDDNIKANIILTAHITFASDFGSPKKDDQGNMDFSSVQGFPNAIGKALSPHIPRWFNSMLIARTVGAGIHAKHKIFTSSQMIDGVVITGKTSAPSKVAAEYPLESGLADYFKALRT